MCEKDTELMPEATNDKTKKIIEAIKKAVEENLDKPIVINLWEENNAT